MNYSNLLSLCQCKNEHWSSQIESQQGIACQFGLAKRIPTLMVLIMFAGQTMADDSKPSLAEADLAIRAGDGKKAVEVLNALIASDSAEPVAYYIRARELFRLGKIEASLKDFDQYVKLQPDRQSRMWERGIACYYAKEFKMGAKQFELYQTFHSEDVENAAWHFLCVARADGLEKARESLLTIRRDGRIPMMTVYDLFAGKAQPADVLAAAEKAPESDRQRATFYANLYLGLYFEASDQTIKARQHIARAAKNQKAGGYMGDVARVHHQRLQQVTK